MLRHLFVLGRDTPVPPEGLAFTLDRHLARGEQIEIIRDRRSPPTDSPNPQSLSGRERRRASPLAEQLRAQGFAIFSRQEEPARRTAAPGVSPGPAPAPPMPPPVAPPIPDYASPFQDSLIDREVRRGPRIEPRYRPRPAARQFGGASLSEDLLEEIDDRREEEEWESTRHVPRRGPLVTVVVMLLVAAGAGFFYFAQQEALGRRSASEQARAVPSELASPAPAPVAPAPPAPVAPASPVPATPPRESEPASPPRSARESEPASPPRSAVEPAPPAPATARSARAPAEERATPEPAPRELPPRASLPPRRAAELPESAPTASATRSRPLAIFPGLPRVEVSRAADSGGTTFIVRLADPAGRPLRDAHVSLRHTQGDGSVRETSLEPISPPGSYRGAMPGTVRRGDPLALRLDLGDRRVEMPVTE